MMMNKERGTPTPGRHRWGGMLVFDGGKGGMLVFQQDLDSSQGVRQSRKGGGNDSMSLEIHKIEKCGPCSLPVPVHIAKMLRRQDGQRYIIDWPAALKIKTFFESMKVVKGDTMSIVNLFKAKYIFEHVLVFANVMY